MFRTIGLLVIVAVVASTEVITQKHLEDFFEKHNPENVRKVTEFLEKYEAQEMASLLKKKYNESPTVRLATFPSTSYWLVC